MHFSEIENYLDAQLQFGQTVELAKPFTLSRGDASHRQNKNPFNYVPDPMYGSSSYLTDPKLLQKRAKEPEDGPHPSYATTDVNRAMQLT